MKLEIDMSDELQGKTVLITGSSRGIGAATATLLAEQGAKVIINYLRSQEKAQELERHINETGGKALAIQGDITNYKDVQKIIKTTINHFGSIDVLVNNAGLLLVGDIDKESITKLHTMIDVNLKGTVNTIHAIVPIMKKQKKGIIINISSLAGKQAHLGYAVYSATKFAVNGLTYALGPELSPHNINIYSICPGPVRTDMIKDLGFGGIPPEKVAKKVADVISNSSNYDTGSDFELPG